MKEEGKEVHKENNRLVNFERSKLEAIHQKKVFEVMDRIKKGFGHSVNLERIKLY